MQDFTTVNTIEYSNPASIHGCAKSITARALDVDGDLVFKATIEKRKFETAWSIYTSPRRLEFEGSLRECKEYLEHTWRGLELPSLKIDYKRALDAADTVELLNGEMASDGAWLVNVARTGWKFATRPLTSMRPHDVPLRKLEDVINPALIGYADAGSFALKDSNRRPVYVFSGQADTDRACYSADAVALIERALDGLHGVRRVVDIRPTGNLYWLDSEGNMLALLLPIVARNGDGLKLRPYAPGRVLPESVKY